MLRKLFNKLTAFYNLQKNIRKCCEFKGIDQVNIGGLVFRGGTVNDIDQLKLIYKELNNVEFSKSNINLLKYCPEKLIIIAEKEIDGRKKIVGMDLFYMNLRDFKEYTIHEGFIGVLPEYEGQGIATQMRKHAIVHFKKAGFKGISTRISKNNIGSLRSSEKLGFKVVEEYYDKVMQEERYYLVLNFKGAK